MGSVCLGWLGSFGLGPRQNARVWMLCFTTKPRPRCWRRHQVRQTVYCNLGWKRVRCNAMLLVSCLRSLSVLLGYLRSAYVHATPQSIRLSLEMGRLHKPKWWKPWRSLLLHSVTISIHGQRLQANRIPVQRLQWSTRQFLLCPLRPIAAPDFTFRYLTSHHIVFSSCPFQPIALHDIACHYRTCHCKTHSAHTGTRVSESGLEEVRQPGVDPGREGCIYEVLHSFECIAQGGSQWSWDGLTGGKSQVGFG